MRDLPRFIWMPIVAGNPVVVRRPVRPVVAERPMVPVVAERPVLARRSLKLPKSLDADAGKKVAKVAEVSGCRWWRGGR